MQENNTKENSSSLMEQAIDSLVADGVASYEKIEQLLNDDPFQQDIFKSLIMEEIQIAESLEQLAVRLEQQSIVFRKQADIINEEFLKKIRLLSAQQSAFTKSQIRRLLADYREPAWKRIIFYGVCGLISILSGMGMFYVYRMIGG